MGPKAAMGQLLERYYPAGIPGYQDWFADAVLDRPHTEYTPQGVRLGSFTFSPSLTQGIGYDSNILNAPTPIGSAYSETSGAIGGASDWSRHGVSADVSFDNVNYFGHSQASYTNWTTGVGGVIDIGRDRLSLSYVHYNVTSLPGEIGSIGIGVPLPSQIDDARVSYRIGLGRVTVVPALEAASYRYPQEVFNGALIDQSINNHSTITGTVTAGYELATGRSLVLVLSDSNGTYDNTPFGSVSPNYNDMAILGGIDDQATGAIRYRVLLGYEQRSYSSSQISTLSAPAGELDVIWTPTLLTTVTGRLSSSLQTATTTGTDGYKYVDAKIIVDHEYRRNIILQANVEYQHADYQTTGGTQNSFNVGGRITWLVNRNMSVAASYRYLANEYVPSGGPNNYGSLVLLQLGFHL